MMDIYYVDCWTSGNPGPGGWQTLLFDKVVDYKNYDDPHSNNFYELSAIHNGCFLASKSQNKASIYSDSRVAIGWCFRDPKSWVLNRSELMMIISDIRTILKQNRNRIRIEFWNTRRRGENPADFGRKNRSGAQWISMPAIRDITPKEKLPENTDDFKKAESHIG